MGRNGYCDQVGLHRSVVVGRQGVQLDGTNCYMSTMFNSVNENDEGLFRTRSREKREREGEGSCRVADKRWPIHFHLGVVRKWPHDIRTNNMLVHVLKVIVMPFWMDGW